MEVSLEKEKHHLAKHLHQERSLQGLYTAGGYSPLAKEKRLPAWRVLENTSSRVSGLPTQMSLSQVLRPHHFLFCDTVFTI